MSNDHYSPQSFLRGWSFDPGKNKVYRYKYIKERNKNVFGEASIRSIASLQDLYSIGDGTKKVSFEDLIMSRALDNPLAKVVAKFRDESLDVLTDDERDQLGRFVLTLEARNPATIEQMTLSEADIDRVVAEAATDASPEGQAEMTNLLMSMRASTGSWAAGAYVSFGYGQDLQALKCKLWTEVVIHGNQRPFVTSDYPTLLGANVPYEEEKHISALAMSPTKALLITSASFSSEFKELDAQTQCRYINLLTIAGASEAYTDQPIADSWIQRHLGWATRTEPQERGHYFQSALSN